MFANSKVKSDCGRLIKIYRENRYAENKAKEYSCSDFILSTRENPFFEIAENEPVCSRATLNRLERGQVIKDEDLYSFFIRKLGYDGEDHPGITDSVNLFSDTLYEAVNEYNVEKMERLEAELEEIFEGIKDSFYYGDVYRLIKVILDYYLRAETPVQEVVDFLYSIRFILNDNIKQLLLNMLFYYYYFLKGKVKLCGQIKEEMDQAGEYRYITAGNRATWMMYKELWMDALQLIDEGIEYYEKKQVPFHLASMYFMKALGLHTGNKENVQYYFEKSIMAFRESKGALAQVRLVKNYFNIGFCYYSNKDYETALKYFKTYLTYNPPFTLHILYIMHCKSLLNNTELDTMLKNIRQHDLSRNTFFNVFYQFFRMKMDNVGAKEIEKFLMKQVLKILSSDFGYPNIIKYFEFELNNLVIETKCYKDLILFKSKTSHKID